MPSDEKSRRHPNRSEKRALKAAELARHVQTAGRKAQKNHDPNDRKYDPVFQKKLRQISPLQIDHLLRDDEDD